MIKILDLEIFRTGTHTDGRQGKTITYTQDDLEHIANLYNSQAKDKAPVVLGHPVSNSEQGYGFVESLKVKGDRLLADLRDVSEKLISFINKKEYLKRSISLDSNNLLRHLGFLGAVRPAVSGLSDDITFKIYSESSNDDDLCFIYSEPLKDDEIIFRMSEEKHDKKTDLDYSETIDNKEFNSEYTEENKDINTINKNNTISTINTSNNFNEHLKNIKMEEKEFSNPKDILDTFQTLITDRILSEFGDDTGSVILIAIEETVNKVREEEEQKAKESEVAKEETKTENRGDAPAEPNVSNFSEKSEDSELIFKLKEEIAELKSRERRQNSELIFSELVSDGYLSPNQKDLFIKNMEVSSGTLDFSENTNQSNSLIELVKSFPKTKDITNFGEIAGRDISDRDMISNIVKQNYKDRI